MELSWIPAGGVAVNVALPPPSSKSALVGGVCVECKAQPLSVAGKFRRQRNGNQYESTAFCTECDAEAGLLLVTIRTVFGIEEDESVLVYGRARVYDRVGFDDGTN